MADARKRRLERDAAQGDLGAGAALLSDRVREGDLDPRRLELLAYLGHPPAERACPERAASYLAWEPWLLGLWRWGREPPLRAALAVARDLDPDLVTWDAPPGAALRACEAWLEDPGARAFDAVRSAAEGLDPFAEGGARAVLQAYQALRASLPTSSLERPRPTSRAAKALVRDALLPWALSPGEFAPAPDPPAYVPARDPLESIPYMPLIQGALAPGERVAGYLSGGEDPAFLVEGEEGARVFTLAQAHQDLEAFRSATPLQGLSLRGLEPDLGVRPVQPDGRGQRGVWFLTPPPRGRPLLEWRSEGPGVLAMARVVAELATTVQALVRAELCPLLLLPRMVRVDGADDAPWLCGLAHELWTGPALWAQEVNAPILRPELAYAAPEQTEDLAGARPGSVAVYQLGVLLFQLLSGRLPHTGNVTRLLLTRIRHEAPPDLAQLAPDAPADLVAVAMDCLEKSPARRFPTPESVAERLRPLISRVA